MNFNEHNIPKADIMTLGEVAEYLKLAERTVLRMAHQKKIPCAKVGSQWRFMRSLIDDWLLSQMQVVPQNDIAKLVELDVESVQISRLVTPDYVINDVQPGSKNEVLAQLVRPLADRGVVNNMNEFLEGLIRREETLSTAIGNGVALPHLRDPQHNPIPGPALIVGICREGTDFEAVDAGKTYLFFIVSTDSLTIHLKLMSRLTRMLQHGDLVEELKAAKTANEVITTLIRADYTMNGEQWRESI